MKKLFCTAMIFAIIILPNICNAASKLETWKFDGEYHAVYPSVNPEINVSEIPIYNKVSDKINEVMKAFWNSVSVTGGFIKSTMNYEITCDKDNLLSMVFTVTMMFTDKPFLYEKDADGNPIPFIYKQTLNFDMRTGDFIEPDNLKNLFNQYAKDKYSPENLTKKVKAYAKKNNIELTSDFHGFNIIPQRYYIDENMHLHFIFAPYELSTKLNYYDFIDIDATL